MQDIEAVYKEYFEMIYKYLILLSKDENLAEELTQETFYRAVKNIDKYKGEAKISTWLCQIAKNLWYDELKRRKQEPLDDIQILDNNFENLPEDAVLSNEKKIELYQNMQKLDKQTREVIYLWSMGGLSFKEIALILNKTEGWARITFYREKVKLKELYDK